MPGVLNALPRSGRKVIVAPASGLPFSVTVPETGTSLIRDSSEPQPAKPTRTDARTEGTHFIIIYLDDPVKLERLPRDRCDPISGGEGKRRGAHGTPRKSLELGSRVLNTSRS